MDIINKQIESILSEAVKCNAIMIFFNFNLDGKKELSGVNPNKKDLLAFLSGKATLADLRYKFRTKDINGKYKYSNYCNFLDFSILKNFSVEKDRNFPIEIYSAAPENLKLSLIKSIYLKYSAMVWSCLELSKLNLNYYSKLISSIPNESKNCPYISFLFTYINTHIAFIESLSAKPTLDEVLYSIDEAYSIQRKDILLGKHDESAFLCVKAKVYGFFDLRGEAAFLFKQATSQSSCIEKLYLDIGAYTYFNSEQVSTEKNNRITRSDSIKIKTSSSTNRITFLISLDPVFLKIYGPNLAYYAMHFNNYDFKFCICSRKLKEAKEAGEAFCKYLSSLSEFSSVSKSINNIEIESIEMPAWVNNEKTYYACYRFFAVEETLREYEAVYTLDADLSFSDNPKNFIEQLQGCKLGLVLGSPKTILLKESPWRLVLAGSVYFENNDDTSDFLHTLNSYLQLGLKQKVSWCLDQNALKYAFEQHVGTYKDLKGRPVYQDPIRSYYEKNVTHNLI